MYHSVESRHPFMDYRVMEYGAKMGDSLNIRNGYGKWALRVAFDDRIPSRIAWARVKRGFEPGVGRWVDRGVGHHLRDIIHSNRRTISEALSIPTSAVNSSRYTDSALSAHGPTVHEAMVLAWVGLWEASCRNGSYG